MKNLWIVDYYQWLERIIFSLSWNQVVFIDYKDVSSVIDIYDLYHWFHRKYRYSILTIWWWHLCKTKFITGSCCLYFLKNNLIDNLLLQMKLMCPVWLHVICRLQLSPVGQRESHPRFPGMGQEARSRQQCGGTGQFPWLWVWTTSHQGPQSKRHFESLYKGYKTTSFYSCVHYLRIFS